MAFDAISVDWLADLLASAADQEIMPRFRRLAAGDIRQKTSAIDLVTEADVNAERVITKRLLEKYPGALIVGEEACSENPAILDGLADAPLAFVLDPVDDTLNFASGVPLFGVMLAVVVSGETVAGTIYDPLGRDWLIGEKGAGSHIRSSDGSLANVRVADAVSVSEMSGAISWNYMVEPLRSRMAGNLAKCRASFNFRCAAHEYRMVASGHGHFVVYNKLMPWDHLAGTLIQQEAGGYAARFDGSAYLPGHLDGGLMIAPDKESWNDLRQALWAAD